MQCFVKSDYKADSRKGFSSLIIFNQYFLVLFFLRATGIGMLSAVLLAFPCNSCFPVPVLM